MEIDNRLSPSQSEAFSTLMEATHKGGVVVVYGHAGSGKSTVLRQAHAKLGGVLLTMEHFVEAVRHQTPLAMEETMESMLRQALESNPVVILDDLHLVSDVICGCRGFNVYPRPGFLNAPLNTLCELAAAGGKKLVFACSGTAPGPVAARCFYASIDRFEVEDYSHICHAYLEPEVAARLDYAKLYRFAPKLNAHQLKGACQWLHSSQNLDTDTFIDYLRAMKMASNVDISEVQAVDLHDLKGIDDLIESLEANVILPMEYDALSAEFNIKPKRGVLLAGPPGTGKTTVGRALAHRLKSKFFLIDGTIISGTKDFYSQIHNVFEAAKDNAPAIIFIDDSDVIFENNSEMGLYRYLLTLLDGLESETAGRICVMMTAMDVGNLPPALIRSGRIELWLETRLPDIVARTAILADRRADLPDILKCVDIGALAAATEDLTGADIKRVIDDGKILYAYDCSKNAALKPGTEYFLNAIQTVRENKEKYALAEARARAQHPSRPSWFDAFSNMGMVMAGGEEDE